MTAGRPTEYTDEIADEICDKLATSGKGLIRLCRENPHWPARSTIFKWRIENQKFSDKYSLAKQNQVETLVDEIIDIADDDSKDTVVKTDKNGNEYESCNSEWINRSKLRIETRKWQAARLMPKKYGDAKNKDTDDAKSLLQQLIDKL